MIIEKERKKVVYKFDTETKLFFNHTSNLWVKNPRQQRGLLIGKAIGKAKGLAKGKAKGKAKNKAIGKAKWKYYNNKLNQYKKEYPTFNKFTLHYPIGLTNAYLQSILVEYNNKVNYKQINKLDIEHFKVILNMIFVKMLYNVSKYKEKKEKIKEYVEIPQTEFKKFLGSDFKFYVNLLLDYDIIQCDKIYFSFKTGGKALGYKINQDYIIKDEIYGVKYNTSDILHPRLRCYAFENKIKIRNISEIEKKYELMKDHVYTLLQHINIDEIKSYCKENFNEFYKSESNIEIEKLVRNNKTITINDFILQLTSIKEGNVYFNVKDKFGERFHSPFTNLKSILRKFVKYENVSYIELDIKNSQMCFLSTILSEPDVASKLIPEYEDIIESLMVYKQTSKDVRLFIDKSLSYEIYEWVAEQLDCTRDEAKTKMFKIIFSQSHENYKLKLELQIALKSFIEMCGIFNDIGKLIPKLSQLMESRIFIHRVAFECLDKLKHPFITIHDSILLHPTDKDKFKEIYNNTFKKLELQILKLK